MNFLGCRLKCLVAPLFVLIALVSGSANSQTTVGIQPLGSYSGGTIDTISNSTLGTHIDIPLFQHQGRGVGMGTTVHLIYDSAYVLGSSPITEMGWRLVAGSATQGTIVAHQDSKEFTARQCEPGVTSCNAGYTNYTYSFAFVDSTGFAHPFEGIANSTQCQGVSPDPCTNVNLNASGYAQDHSGFYMKVNPVTASPTPDLVTVTTPAGVIFSTTAGSPATATDTNGNSGLATISSPAYWVSWNSTVTDNTGIAATITGGAYSSSDSTKWASRAPIQVEYLDTQGTQQTITVNYSLHTVTSGCTSSTKVGMADSIVYPDGSTYEFTYQADGQLQSMQLPTGGTIAYNPGSSCPTATSGGYVGLPATTSRSTLDGLTTYSQTATPLAASSIHPATSITNITHPDGSTEQIHFVYTLAYEGEATGDVNYNYETAHTWSSSAGTVLKSTMRCYNGATGDCTTTAVARPITQISTTTTTGSSTSKEVAIMNAAGLTTEQDDYDYGASSPTRKTVTSYASLSNNIVNRPSSITIYNASGTAASSSTYGYDEYSLTATSGLLDHSTVSGARGNRTSQHLFLNTTGGTVDSHWQYDDAGQVLAAEDPLLNWTHYGYDTATDACLIATTPPTPVSGVSQATSGICDSNTGLVTSTTDANKVKTSYSYDGMLRPTTTSTASSAGTVIATSTRSYSGSTLPEVITTTVSATPSPSEISTVTLDGLGRVMTSVDVGGARVDTTYNSMGLIKSVSNPYLSTSDATYGITSYLYDGLGRRAYQCNPDNSSTQTTTCSAQSSYQQWTYSNNSVTQKDERGNSWNRTSDAFGRLTNVTEPTGAATNYVYDVLGNLTSVTQTGLSGETARTRSFSYDSLSRLSTAANPETGTVCYGKISGSTCTADYDANGNLLAKTDARGLVVTYQYDTLNRMIAKSGTGINYSYTYDQATQGTFTSTNPVGRLVWASNGVNADIHYSYDAMGRVVSQTGCTPDNCSSVANPVSAQYDLAGNMTSLTYPDGRVISQGFDGAAHLNSVSYASWNGAAQSVPYLSVASSNGYDAAGHLINATMGNGIGLAAAYNNREEISSLAYGTSSQLLWGRQLAWTANGNLQTTSDPLTNIQRQFGYDNLNRLTSAQDIFAASTVADTSPFAIGAGGVDGSSVTSDGATGVWTNPDDSNILINPDQPGASGWEVANANIANGVLAPDGTTTAAIFTATSGSTDTFLGAIAAQGSLMDGETMTGSVWLRAPNGSQVIDLYLVEVGTPGNVVTASKQITVTTTWQQFQLSGKFQYGYGDLIFQIGGGGTVKSGQAISLWESKLEDAGTSGIDVTNFLPYSQQINPQTWGLQAATYSNNSGTAPDGSNTAITVTASSGSTDTWLIDAVQNPAPFGGTSITGSVWLRSPSGSQNISLTLVTTNAGTLGQTTVALTSTWQRFQVSGTTPTTLTELQLQIGGAGTFTNGQSVQIWGAQVELANVAGPYVPTDGVPATIGANLTNLLPYSQEPNAPSWILTNTTGVPDAVAAPDSSTTAFQMTVSSGVTDAWATDNVTNPALYDGATVTESLFARIPGSTALTVDLYIVAQTASGRTYIGPTSMQLNGNWQRFTVHGKLPNGLTSLFLQIGGSGTFSSGQTIDIWGAQLELASNAGPYVMTTAQPVIEGKELTNILPNSQMLSGPSWGVSYGSAVNNAAVAPDGTTTASIVTGTASSPDTYAIHSVPNPSLYDGETVTASVYLRVASGTLNTDLFLVNVGDANWSDTAQVPITLTTTWQRFSITGTNQNGLSQLSLQIGGGGSVTSGASFQVWGAQMVVGSSAAPYIIATSSTTNTATGQAASVAPNGLNQSFTYDSFGNLQQNGSFTSTYTAQNQMFGYAYDAAGNLLSNGIINMSWDAEGKLASAGGANYVYTPEGDRVSKLGVGETDTIYFGGRPIARFSAGAWTDLIYGPNGLLAEVSGTQAATPNYRLLDHLGTQVGTVGNNGLLVNPTDYTPFGQAFSGATSDPYVYTGKERDTESGLDYFGARYYGSSMGRFMSPDPSGLYYADPSNPQSLNLYSYAQNSPLNKLDPTGRECVWDDGSYDAADDAQTGNAAGCSGQGGTYVNPDLFENALLTNGQNANIQYGSWSGQANSTLQQSWVDPSANVYGSNSPQPTVAAGLADFLTTTTLGKLNNFGNNLLWSPANLPAPNILLNTTYCGKGGAGATTGPVNGPCAAHDKCFEQAGLSADSNAGGTLTLEQAAAAQACNQGLYDAVRMHNNAPGSKAIQLWLTNGDNVPFGYGHLAPGTEAAPW